ncbi:MAG: glutathione S-transferase family protein [Candidatus Dadabacteria bacterium]|nr:glutathione S-transferase family protein [Candidatus Dadabacteria bacterium]
MADIVFYSNPQSRGQVAHWMLEELGEPYETRWMDYGGPMKSPEYLSVNPMGKVPAIRHKSRDAVVTETAAICAYLAMTYPSKGLVPAVDDPALADFHRWLFFAAGPLETALTARSMKWDVSPEKSSMLGFGSYRATLDAIEGHLKGGEFVCRSGFSAADVYVGSQLIWGLRFGTVEPRQAFREYTDRLVRRDAYRRAERLCDERAAVSRQ